MPEREDGADPESVHAVVTGVNGFLGRALAARLEANGTRVTGVDLHEESVGAITGGYLRANIADYGQVRMIAAALAPGRGSRIVVFHLAAVSHVGQCQADPQKAYAINVTGTFNVLEACRELRVDRLVFPSTALVYATPTDRRPIHETDPLMPRSFYAATKRACEVLMAAYGTSYGLRCRIARLSNVYGPDGPRDSVVNVVLDQVRAGGPLRLRTLAPVRDFIYRDDVVGGLIALAGPANEPGCEIVNLGSGTATSIRDLVDQACAVGRIAPIVTETAGDSHLGHKIDDTVVLSITRLVEQYRWRPMWTLEAGLRHTLNGEEPGTDEEAKNSGLYG